MKRTEGLEALMRTLQTEKFCSFLKETLPMEGPLGRGSHMAGVSQLGMKTAWDENASSLK